MDKKGDMLYSFQGKASQFTADQLLYFNKFEGQYPLHWAVLSKDVSFSSIRDPIYTILKPKNRKDKDKDTSL